MRKISETPTFLADQRSTYEELRANAEARWPTKGTRRRSGVDRAESASSSAPVREPEAVPARAVSPPLDVVAWDVAPADGQPPEAPPEARPEPPPPAVSSEPLPEATPEPPRAELGSQPPGGGPANADAPISASEASREVAGIVRGREASDPTEALVHDFLDELARTPASPPHDLAEEASGRGPTPAPPPSIFLPAVVSSDYAAYVQPVTQGNVTLLINGRSSGGPHPDVNRTEPLDRMQEAVQSLKSGDSVWLSAWFFEPSTVLTRGNYGSASTWGGLFARKAEEGVNIRILVNDFDPISRMDQWVRRDNLAVLDPIVATLPAAKRDNLKYVLSLHPAHVGRLKALLATGEARNIHIASHHQKFMVCRRGDETIAFCGGLDIESRKTPADWGYPPAPKLVGWHDLHVMLEGPIARDLQREFALRWNREKGSSQRAPLAGWSGYDTLTPLGPPTAAEPDGQTVRRKHSVQMLRTVSSDALTSPYSTDRDDIRQVYRKIADRAASFLYLENQYFRSVDYAKHLAAQAKAKPSLIAIFVVLFSAVEDDGDNAITAHGAHLQHEFFTQVTRAFGARARIYTMFGRSVHSKLLMADDRWLCVGSANLNDRSFELDSELNVAVEDDTLVRTSRQRLWAHNLGAPEATVRSWAVSDYLTSWDDVANKNRGRTPSEMEGEGILPFDWKASPGKAHSSIPDALAKLDFDLDKELVGREGGPRVA
jgi:phosphatidylserine/phosphatidylglycerophosphate/cardiolipin synthase-like enzyme